MAWTREQVDLLGAIVALAAFVLADAVFAARLARMPGAERVAGILMVLLALPAAFLLFTAGRLERPTLSPIRHSRCPATCPVNVKQT